MGRFSVPFRPIGQIPKGRKTTPSKRAYKDRNARWIVKFSQAKAKSDGFIVPFDIVISTSRVIITTFRSTTISRNPPE